MLTKFNAFFHQCSSDAQPSAVEVHFRVSFTETTGGLVTPQNAPGGFELAGKNKSFHPADAKIDNNTVVVTSAAVPESVAVRYAWHNSTEAGLFNGEGLPAVPFRSDTW